ncbi:restriction endonuclease [Planococcus plakortidis]|nr:restriction endonuclease [Planococcus plakortidis]
MGLSEGFKMGLELMWGIVTAEPLLTGFLVLFIAGSLLLTFIINTLRYQKLKKSGILKVDEMTGREFEEYLRVLFRERGYQVQLTPATGDYGADLILSAKGQKVVVQAKRYKKNVGLKAVQEISTAKNHFNADECWVVTNSHYTEPARKLAASNRVRLVDRELLMKWMLEMKKDNETQRTASVGKVE